MKEFTETELEEIRRQWLTEQHALATQVVVPPDDWTTVVAQNESHRLTALLETTATTNEPSGAPTTNQYFGGVDVSFPEDSSTQKSIACYVVIDRTTHAVVYQDDEYFHLTVPYMASFLAFREIDPIVRLIEKQIKVAPAFAPAAILVDGNGVWHPRRAGVACFVGVRTGIPTIGIGKTLHCMSGLTHAVVDDGIVRALERARHVVPILMSVNHDASQERLLFDRQPIRATRSKPVQNDNERNISGIDVRACLQTMAPYCRGLAIPLQVNPEESNGHSTTDETTTSSNNNNDKNNIWACALVGHGGRIKGKGQQPMTGGTKNAIYVSVGHGLSLRNAVEITASLSQARIPEPVRQADLRGRDLLRKAQAAKEGVADVQGKQE